jgi:hypothetical protein
VWVSNSFECLGLSAAGDVFASLKFDCRRGKFLIIFIADSIRDVDTDDDVDSRSSLLFSGK